MGFAHPDGESLSADGALANQAAATPAHERRGHGQRRTVDELARHAPISADQSGSLEVSL